MYTGTQQGEGSAPNAPPPSYNPSAPPASGDYTAPPPNYSAQPPVQNNYGGPPQPVYGGEGQGQPINNFHHPPPTAAYVAPPPNQGYQPPNQGYQPPVINQGYTQPPPNQQQMYTQPPAQNYTQPPPQQQYVPHPTTQVPTQQNQSQQGNGRPAGRKKFSELTHRPVQTTCRNCNEYVTTKITESGPDCGTCGVCLLVSCCLCPICGIAACCWDRTWNHTHSCPKCGFIIGSKDAFGAHYNHK